MIKNGDFIKLHYTGKLSDGMVFDTTNAVDAKNAGMDGTRDFAPITICVGQHMLLPGLDEQLIGKDFGKHTIHLSPDKAFGKKDPKLLKIIPTEQLHAQQINPHPGLRLNIDGSYGVVRSTSSGRTIVDFNHPLASQEVTYDVELIEKVTDHTAQVKALLAPVGIPYESVTVTDESVVIKLPQLLPQPLMDALQKHIVSLTGLKTVTFEQGTAPVKQTKQ